MELKKENQLAITNIPCQNYEEPMDFEDALYVGTIFPSLDMPFYKADKVEKPSRSTDLLKNGASDESNRCALKKEIDEASFAAIDMQLYLDMHPDDTKGLEFFQECLKKRKYAMEEFSSKYYPLKLDCVFHNPAGENRWSWADGPIPWEGGC